MGFLPTFIYYVATIFIVILAYFHMECINEKEEEVKTPRFDKFNSEETQCKNIEFAFVPKGSCTTLPCLFVCITCILL